MAKRRRLRGPRLWRPIPLTDDWLVDVWELQVFGGLQLTVDRRLPTGV